MRFTPELLVFNSAYTYEKIIKQNLQVFIESKDAGSLFNSVLTANPIASLQYGPSLNSGTSLIKINSVTKKNIMVEGKINSNSIFRYFKKLDFFLVQIYFLFILFKKFNLKEVKIIRAEDPRFNGLWGYVMSKLLRKPLVIGVWGNPRRIRSETNLPLMPKLFKSCRTEEIVEKFILNKATIVLAQNQDNMNYVRSLGISEDKLRIVPLGIDIHSEHFKNSKERANLDEEIISLGLNNKKIIVCISRLEKSKRIDQVILSLKHLKNKFLNCKLVIIGDGSEAAYLKNLINDIGVSDQVVLVGNRSQIWIASILKYADIGVAPLTGRALLEMGLAGCPVIAYDIDWHSQLVIDNVTGFLVEDSDIRKFGLKILFLLNNDNLRKQMGINMRALSLEFADLDYYREFQAKIYSDLMRNSG